MNSILSCTKSPGKTYQNRDLTTSTNSFPDTLTQQQQAAFDALNTLQVSTDERNHLYSTFPNINQPCYPPDTSLVISQSEFLEAMEVFVSIHCTILTEERRTELANVCVLAQKHYAVKFCFEESENPNFANGIPLKGVWVLPNILGRRDLTLVW